ncbi:MAG: flagellar basal body L-ring protein FlgH [Candidatus Cloacimonetes bacterium]|jgi:flagellar L-ring protein precursor FlgH|nr:flagellar basal body L-ring protein FlgH [Candidatus Cloacimonadota bacterium]
MNIRMMAVLLLSVLGSASAHAQQNTAPTQATPAAQLPAPVSWTGDRRHFEVGDIITVLIDEQTIASADRSNVAADDRTSVLALDGGFRAGTGGTNGARASVRSTNSADSRQRGQARRSDRLAAEITVRVVEVEPNGVLRLEGTKTLRIDEGEQSITLTGLARAHDVSARNVIESWRLADAQIAYTSNGKFAQPKRSLISRIIGILWP